MPAVSQHSSSLFWCETNTPSIGKASLAQKHCRALILAVNAAQSTTELAMSGLIFSSSAVNYVFLSHEKSVAAVTLAFISCSLSIFGSVSIIYVVCQGKNVWKDKDQVYHRLMLGLSTFDTITSIACFLAPFVNRKDTNLFLASGSIATCAWDGFFFQFYLGSVFYNCALSVYFLRIIRYNQSPAKVFWHESLIHCTAIVLPLTFGIAGLLMDVYNPGLMMGICVYAPYPWNCLLDDSIKCERGSAVDWIRWPHTVLYFLLPLIGIVCTWLVYWTIRQQALRSQQWDDEADENRRKRTRAVAIQAIWYAVVLFVALLSCLFVAVLNAVYLPNLGESSDLEDNTIVYIAILFLYIFFPFQGFLNWIVYIRPRLIRWKEANPEKSWLWAYRQVWSGKVAPLIGRSNILRSPSVLPSSKIFRLDISARSLDSEDEKSIPSPLNPLSPFPHSEEEGNLQD